MFFTIEVELQLLKSSELLATKKAKVPLGSSGSRIEVPSFLAAGKVVSVELFTCQISFAVDALGPVKATMDGPVQTFLRFCKLFPFFGRPALF